MIIHYVTELQRAFSVDRLERYRPSGGDDLAMIVTYHWNIALCETFYHSLGALEMVLRNNLHGVLTTHFGRPDWYDVPGFLMQRQIRQLNNAKQEIATAGKVVIPGRVVAGLTFGFWTALVSRGYGHFWSNNNHALIKQAFPLAPVHMQYRGRAHSRFNEIRNLRNRVFHYESICDDPKLLQKQANILETIGWISPTLQGSVKHFDRFQLVHQNGMGVIETNLKQHLGIP